MKIATIRVAGGTAAVRIDSEEAVELGHPDVVDVLSTPGWHIWAAEADGARHDLAGLDYAPVVVRPEKIICVGLNYRQHILEMGRELPDYPTLFAKFTRSLVGAYDTIELPAASDAIDWEAELAVVIGAPVRNESTNAACAAIAGFTVINDVTARDWQYRTPQWLQGKTFEASTPVGPFLVTDHGGVLPPSEVRCTIDGRDVQKANTADLVFDPATLVAYISQIITLVPGDLIATGTPGGVGHARDPRQYIHDQSVVETSIDGLGACRNRFVSTLAGAL
jgi:acylpyruvate hydrolase